jgi:hypothetical protein
MGMASKKPTVHCVIPDTQIKEGVDTSHLSWIGQYIADKRPDVIVQIGDFGDLRSLSSHERGRRSSALLTYAGDIAAIRAGMKRLMEPIKAVRGYKPRLVLTLGNHEERILRTIEEDGRLYGTIGLKDLGYEEWGWEVVPYLTPIVIDGICYAHFFQSGVMGRPVSSARALVRSRHMSATMGHVQKTEIDMGDIRADGKQIIGLFCGVCYLHDEPYLGQLNAVRRQIVFKHDVQDGQYDPMFVSLDFLRRKYGRKAA